MSNNLGWVSDVATYFFKQSLKMAEMTFTRNINGRQSSKQELKKKVLQKIILFKSK